MHCAPVPLICAMLIPKDGGSYAVVEATVEHTLDELEILGLVEFVGCIVFDDAFRRPDGAVVSIERNDEEPILRGSCRVRVDGHALTTFDSMFDGFDGLLSKKARSCKLTKAGYETASGKPRQGGGQAGQEKDFLNGFVGANMIWYTEGIPPSRLSEGKRQGRIRWKNAPQGQRDSQGKAVRILYHVADAKQYASPKHVKEKTRKAALRKS